ncbi:hypothetical protein B0T10DRAFT_460196 [Thelonectria olida]|uniref:Uncharacterized protein n=1 Tax=Thelonectria olida TaxID=1576542 RepID=A0A9P8W655_9HYPO|nr:hypothetical protein B0T10DRAFT_460196 [Thelonectria olida]
MPTLLRTRLSSVARSPLTLRSLIIRHYSSADPAKQPLKGGPIQTETDKNKVSDKNMYVLGMVGLALGGTLAWMMNNQRLAGKVPESLPEPTVSENRFEDKNKKVLGKEKT